MYIFHVIDCCCGWEWLAFLIPVCGAACESWVTWRPASPLLASPASVLTFFSSVGKSFRNYFFIVIRIWVICYCFIKINHWVVLLILLVMKVRWLFGLAVERTDLMAPFQQRRVFLFLYTNLVCCFYVRIFRIFICFFAIIHGLFSDEFIRSAFICLQLNRNKNKMCQVTKFVEWDVRTLELFFLVTLNDWNSGKTLCRAEHCIIK